METDKNIQLTVIRQPEDTDGELRIDLSLIFSWMKRLFSLWLVAAVAAGMLVAPVLKLEALTPETKKVSALIGLTYKMSAENKTAAISKLNSPASVESALASVGMEKRLTDNVRSKLSVASVLSDEAQDRMSLYYGILSKSANMEAVNQLLSTDTSADSYIVSLDYSELSITKESAVQLLNAVIDEFRKEIESTSNYNDAVGNAFGIIDYSNYDYAEAASLYANVLDKLESYINSVKSTSSGQFRSSKTGYTFDDLLKLTSMIRDIELDQISSYIAINAVSSHSVAQEKAYYEWLIEETNRKKAVEEENLASITDSIAKYEKDPVIYFSDESLEDTVKDYYDTLISNKIASRNTISAYSRTISYYQDLISGFEKQTEASNRTKDRAEESLSNLNKKVEQLIDDVKLTVDEYYDRASLKKTVEVLVPALPAGSSDTVLDMKKSLLIVEAAIIVAYLGAAVILGIRDANPKKDAAEAKEQAV